MEVILREDVKGLGKAGALVRVKPGYGRNFLLPRGLAFEATEGNKKRIENAQNQEGQKGGTWRMMNGQAKKRGVIYFMIFII